MEEFPKFWRKAIKGSVGGRFMNKKGDPEELRPLLEYCVTSLNVNN